MPDQKRTLPNCTKSNFSGCGYTLSPWFDFERVTRVDFSHVLVLFFHNLGSRVPAAVARIGKRVRIPRCRATVSEEKRNRSLEEDSGKASCYRRTLKLIQLTSSLVSQETGANRNTTPFAFKGGVRAFLLDIYECGLAAGDSLRLRP